MKASEYEVSSGDITGRAWLTNERPEIDRVFDQLAQLSKPMEKLTGTDQISAQLADKGLPLLVQTLHGNDYSTNELIGIDEGRIDDSVVQIPPGYTAGKLPGAP